MDREAIKSIIEKQKTVLSLALGSGLRNPDTRVDEVVAENAQATITELEKLIELPMHPDPEINKEVNVDIQVTEEADKKAGLPPEDFSEMFISSIGNDWLPTSENINKLPEPIRLYIHDLETKCDPGGDVQTIASQKDQIGGLTTRIKELEGACDVFEKNSQEASEVFEVLMRHRLIPMEKPGPRLADVVTNVILLSEKVHTMLGRFPGSDLAMAAEVRMNEYRTMTEKYEAMKVADVERTQRLDKVQADLAGIKSLGDQALAQVDVVKKEFETKINERDREINRLIRKFNLTVVDLGKAIARQRLIGGREAGSLMSKYIIPAAKRLGWKPPKEKARGKSNSRVRGR